MGFVVNKVALGQVFSEYFGFPCQLSFHILIHTHHLSFGAGTIGQTMAAVPSGLSLTPTREAKKVHFYYLRIFSIEMLVISTPHLMMITCRKYRFCLGLYCGRVQLSVDIVGARLLNILFSILTPYADVRNPALYSPGSGCRSLPGDLLPLLRPSRWSSVVPRKFQDIT
jgi:hypothetical protein